MVARARWESSTRSRGWAWLLSCVVWGTTVPAGVATVEAADPRIDFDLPPVVECRDVTPAEFAELHPDRRIIEATLRVSMRLQAGAAEDVREITIEIASPHQSLLVHDYAPDLVLESELAGEIQITKTRETGSSLGAGVNGGTSLPYGGVNVNLSPHASLGASKRDLTTETIKRIPAKDVVLVGGTMDHGYGVFFKFRPTGQTPLEGRKEFVCRYVAPREWRGDYVRVAIRATGEHKEYFMKSVKPSGQLNRELGLYLAGDEAAQGAAWRLAVEQGLAPPRRENSPARVETFQQSAAANAATEQGPAPRGARLSQTRPTAPPAPVAHQASRPVAAEKTA